MGRTVARISLDLQPGPEGDQHRHYIEQQCVDPRRVEHVDRCDEGPEKNGSTAVATTAASRLNRWCTMKPLVHNEAALGSQGGRWRVEHGLSAYAASE